MIYYCNFEISFYLSILMTKTLRFFTMKRLLPFIALCCFYFGTAQTQSFDINWDGSITLSTSDSSIELPSFDSKTIHFRSKMAYFFSPMESERTLR